MNTHIDLWPLGCSRLYN